MKRQSVVHYKSGNIECIDYIADQGWAVGYILGNIVKYAVRCMHKGTPIEDLTKIINYATILIDYIERKKKELLSHGRDKGRPEIEEEASCNCSGGAEEEGIER